MSSLGHKPREIIITHDRFIAIFKQFIPMKNSSIKERPSQNHEK